MPSLTRRDLYAADPNDFVRLRDQLARELKAEGEKDDSAAVRKLRRPTVAVWALNQVAHREPALVEDLLDTAARARTAQLAALGGNDASELREALAARRSAVAKVARAARGTVDESGRSGDAQDRDIENALTVLVGTGRLDDEFRRGELSAVGAGEDDGDELLAALAESVPAEPASARKPAAPPKPKGPSRELLAARRAVDSARARLDKARADVAAAEAALEDAEQRVAELEE